MASPSPIRKGKPRRAALVSEGPSAADMAALTLAAAEYDDSAEDDGSEPAVIPLKATPAKKPQPDPGSAQLANARAVSGDDKPV